MSDAPSSEAMWPEPDDGRDAVRQIGADILAAVDLAAINARLTELPSGVLLAELENVLAAIDSSDPVRRRQRAGVFGRLIGRDLVAEAQTDSVESRVRLHVLAAQAHADALIDGRAELRTLSTSLQQQVERLSDLLAREGTSLPVTAVHESARQRRLQHLDAILASWRMSVSQIAMVCDHAAALLDRHAQLRDVLVPLWRQRASAEAVAAQLDRERAAAIADVRDALRAQLASLHTSAPRLPADATPIERIPKEPSP
jgi:hypothetical protein